jgi:Ni,Fe-hydrogenase I large subunit
MERLDGVASFPHRFGGAEYRLAQRELGHVHGDELDDVPFPRRIRDEVIDQGWAEPHHLLPETGWVSCHLRRPEDVEHAMALLLRSYALALEQRSRRDTPGSGESSAA